MSHDILPRLLRGLTDATRTLLTPAPARRSERRVRLQVEALEEKIVPSTARTLPQAKFDGTYKVTFSGRVPVQGGYRALKGSYGIQVKNGVNATFRGIYLRINGQATINGGKPTAKGTWVGTYLGSSGNGTWVAAPFRIR
jgi:hypothetical protein